MTRSGMNARVQHPVNPGAAAAAGERSVTREPDAPAEEETRFPVSQSISPTPRPAEAAARSRENPSGEETHGPERGVTEPRG